jgi:1-acyl-sn-glycerol-3-phosphate acyltransferase
MAIGWVLRLKSFRLVLKLYLKLNFGLEVRGTQHLTRDLLRHGGLILAGNHAGLLDVPAVVAAFKHPFTFLVREEVLEWEKVGWLVKHGNTLTLWKDQQKKVLAEVVERLSQGERFAIFPEGQLSRDGSVGPFLDGVGYLSAKTHTPILPFVIHGGFAAWPEGAPSPRRGTQLVLEFLPPLRPDPTASVKAERRRLTDTLRDTVIATLARGPKGEAPS